MQFLQSKETGSAGQGSPIVPPTAYIELLKMSMPAESKFVSFARHAVQGVTQQLRMNKDTADDLLLAVGEACSNAVLYAGRARSQSLSITCRIPKAPSESRSLEVDIRNHGDNWAHHVDDGSFDMPAAELLSEHGRGLPLMHSLVDLVEVLSDGGDTLVRLTKLVM